MRSLARRYACEWRCSGATHIRQRRRTLSRRPRRRRRQRQLQGGEEADEVVQEPPPEPVEGWWVIGEALRAKGITVGGEKVGANVEMTHNYLAGSVPVTAGLRNPSIACEMSFDAPDVPGEYKLMVHVRSSGCVGVDVRRKVSFQVLRAKRSHPPSSSGGSTEDTASAENEAECDAVPPLAEEDEVPPLLEGAAS